MFLPNESSSPSLDKRTKLLLKHYVAAHLVSSSVVIRGLQKVVSVPVVQRDTGS